MTIGSINIVSDSLWGEKLSWMVLGSELMRFSQDVNQGWHHYLKAWPGWTLCFQSCLLAWLLAGGLISVLCHMDSPQRAAWLSSWQQLASPESDSGKSKGGSHVVFYDLIWTSPPLISAVSLCLHRSALFSVGGDSRGRECVEMRITGICLGAGYHRPLKNS